MASDQDGEASSVAGSDFSMLDAPPSEPKFLSQIDLFETGSMMAWARKEGRVIEVGTGLNWIRLASDSRN